MHIARTAFALLIVLAASMAARSDTAGTQPRASGDDARDADHSVFYPVRDTPEASVERGRIAFDHYCVLCHGPSRDGNGRAARLYNPRPSNLLTSDKNAAYKDLIIRRGGAALGRSPYMPPWDEELTEEQLTDLVNFLSSIVSPRAKN